MSKKKKSKNKPRNAIVIAMIKRVKKSIHKNKKTKRQNGKNKQKQFLNEDY